jgi:hypothetical protein
LRNAQLLGARRGIFFRDDGRLVNVQFFGHR